MTDYEYWKNLVKNLSIQIEDRKFQNLLFVVYSTVEENSEILGKEDWDKELKKLEKNPILTKEDWAYFIEKIYNELDIETTMTVEFFSSIFKITAICKQLLIS